MHTILLVEDENALRRLFCAALSADYQVIESSDGRNAKQVLQLQSEKIDLLLTDASLPYMSGMELAASGRLLRPEMKCVIMSGDAGALSGTEGGETAPRFIAKPFDLGELRKLISEVLVNVGNS